MKKILTSIFNRHPKTEAAQSKPSASVVRQVADQALKTYDRTFRDLARYDRGEPLRTIINPVSR